MAGALPEALRLKGKQPQGQDPQAQGDVALPGSVPPHLQRNSSSTQEVTQEQ